MKPITETGPEVLRSPSINDVASRAGVSTATVSRYLNGLAVKRSEDIQRVIAQLGYQPHWAARALRSRASKVIGLVVPDISNPYFAAVIEGIESVGRDRGYVLLLFNTDETLGAEQVALDELHRRRVDGLIMAPVNEDSDLQPDLEALPCPVVFLDRVTREGNTNCVLIDNVGGARKAVEYLAGLGHTRIAFISGPLNTTPGRERYEGFLSAMEDLELDVPQEYVKISDFRERGGYQATLSLLGERTAPTAVFVANNLMSIGALKAFHHLGIRPPRDLSFVGFDDLEMADLLSPAPTVIARPMAEQGVLAMRLLLHLLDEEPAGPPQRLVLDTQLVVRASTGPPPGVPGPSRAATVTAIGAPVEDEARTDS